MAKSSDAPLPAESQPLSLMARKFLAAEADGWKPDFASAESRQVEESDFRRTYFFYGSLTDSSNL